MLIPAFRDTLYPTKERERERERERKYRVPTECAFKGHMNRCMHSLNLHKSQLYALLNCPKEDREIIIMRISSCMRQVGERGKKRKEVLEFGYYNIEINI